MKLKEAKEKALKEFRNWNKNLGIFPITTKHAKAEPTEADKSELEDIIRHAVEIGMDVDSVKFTSPANTTMSERRLLELVEFYFGKGCADICRERMRQQEKEGFDETHDDQHTDGELAEAASCYAAFAESISFEKEDMELVKGEVSDDALLLVARNHRWPWQDEWWKPTPENRQKELSKAGALLAAEKDRIYRIPEPVKIPDHHNNMTIHVHFAHKRQQRKGNINQAIKEFVAAHDEWEEECESNFREADEEIEAWRKGRPEPGTKENPFRAKNGVVIYYES